MTILDIPFFDWWRQNCQQYKALLFDIDGTILKGRQALPGALEIIDWLREKHYPFFLLTNDGNHSAIEKSQLLSQGGFNIDPDEIVSCSMALNHLAAEHELHNQLFFVMGSLGEPDYAELAGLRVTRNVKELDQCRGIIIGEGRYDWQHNISAVINSLRRNVDRFLIVPNPDSYWPDGRNGDIGIGAGSKARFIQSLLLEMGISVNITYLGKPHSLIFEYTIDLLKERYQLSRDIAHEQIMMLGDSLASDITGANRFGLTSSLMLTGITALHQLKKSEVSLEETPDFVFNSIL